MSVVKLLFEFGKKVQGRVRHFLFSRVVTTIVLFVILAPPPALADADLSLGGSFRSYPLSGVAEVKSGYGMVLYGQKNSPFSGYIRPALEGYSALLYNSGIAKLEIFPLAILGARAGGESIQNDNEYTAYDCKKYRCLGRNYRTFFETELTLGAGPFFIQGRWRRERWTQPDPEAGDFVDPTSGLLMKSQGESQTVYTAVSGVKLSPTWTVMAGLRYAEDEDGISRMPFLLLSWKNSSWTVSAGGGGFESSLKDRSATALLSVTWEILPSVALR